MRSFPIRNLFTLGLLLGASSLGVAAETLPQRTSSRGNPQAAPQIPLQRMTLKNGLRVVLSEDHAAPTVSLCVTYDVGSRNEQPSRTGFAHLFEHMMFQGSQNVGKGEHLILIRVNGGDVNGTTSNDVTNYYERVPANQLDMALFLESDRMRALRVTQANLDNQRSTVQEERRLRMDNQAYGKTGEILEDLVYDNFAYKHSTMGSMSDLNAATLADVAQFFKTYYAPNNAVLTLVGDFKTPEAIEKIRKYFDDIPQQPAAPSVDMTEARQTAERRLVAEDSFARLARLDIAYKTAPGNTADWYALDMLGDILFSGSSSRLYQKLVKGKGLVLQVMGGSDLRRGTSLFECVALLKPGQDPGEVEKLIYDEMADVAAHGVTSAELEKIRTQDRLLQAQSLTSTLNRAREIGRYTVFFDDPNLINTSLANYAKITSAELERVARAYLAPTQRTVLLTNPKAPAAVAQAASSTEASR